MPFTPSTLCSFLLGEYGASLASVDTPVETVMGNNGLLLELYYFKKEGIEGVFFSLYTVLLFCGSSRSCSNLFWVVLLVASYSGNRAANIVSTTFKLGLTLSISTAFFVLRYTACFGLGTFVNSQNVPLDKFQYGCVAIWLRQNSAAK